MINKQIKLYKKEYDYSYVIGASPTIELIKTRRDLIETIYVHTKFTDLRLLQNLCGNDIQLLVDDKTFNRLSIPENNYVIGVFRKYRTNISRDRAHVLLVNPSDMGNLGSIIRTLTGFGYNDLAIITPAADIFNPKTIRASMGAIFKINFQSFDTITEYTSTFKNHAIYPFMLDSDIILNYDTCPLTSAFTLVFGNESCGLSDEYTAFEPRFKIPQSSAVDSLNLSVAVGIGTYIFAVKNNLI